MKITITLLLLIFVLLILLVPNNIPQNSSVSENISACPEIDINNDSQINLVDFANFASFYNKQCSLAVTCNNTIDSDNNNIIDLIDFANFAQKYVQSTYINPCTEDNEPVQTQRIISSNRNPYGLRVNAGNPTLYDLWSGKAKIQSIEDSQQVTINFRAQDRVTNIWDQKISFVYNTETNKYMGFTRGFVDDKNFNIFLLESIDGITFQSLGPLFTINTQLTSVYDPHITLNYATQPVTYTLVFECNLTGNESVSSCISETKTPYDISSWTRPKLIIVGCDNNPATGCKSETYASASTPVSLVDEQNNVYISHTVVNDGKNWPFTKDIPDEGIEYTLTRAQQYNGTRVYANEGTGILRAQQLSTCLNNNSASWDCNQKDMQDWKIEIYENGYETNYFALYNGGNYYRCIVPDNGKPLKNIWGINIAKSVIPVSRDYSIKTTPLIIADQSNGQIRTDICGISYPAVNNVNGELYIYYAIYHTDGTNKIMRSKLIW